MHLVVLLYALFASVFVIAKTGLQFTEPLFLVGSRMFFAGLILLGYDYFKGGKITKVLTQPRTVWRIFLLALFNIYLTNALEFFGLRFLPAFKTCFIYSLSPFLSALFSYMIFSETLTKKKCLGLILGILGFIPLILYETTVEEELSHIFIFSWAEMAMLGAAVCSVYGWILLRQLVREDSVQPTLANGLSMLLGGTFSLIHSYIVESWNPVPITEFFPFFECAILLIIISNLICYNLYGYLLKKFTATFMSFAGFTTPLFTALFGWLFLNEEVTWPFYFSVSIVFCGLLIFYQEELQEGYYVKTYSS